MTTTLQQWRAIATDGYPPLNEAVLVTNGKTSAVLLLKDMNAPITVDGKVVSAGPTWEGDAFGGYECEIDFEYENLAATHWMPLPLLPKRGSDD